jgi:hypothetical protein
MEKTAVIRSMLDTAPVLVVDRTRSRTTWDYLHARPESSSGLRLDAGVWLR